MSEKIDKNVELLENEFNTTTYLVERSIEGDSDALSVLCEKISKGVMYRVSYGLENREDAEDVTQEVLIDVCEKIYELREPRAFNCS